MVVACTVVIAHNGLHSLADADNGHADQGCESCVYPGSGHGIVATESQQAVVDNGIDEAAGQIDHGRGGADAYDGEYDFCFQPETTAGEMQGAFLVNEVGEYVDCEDRHGDHGSQCRTFYAKIENKYEKRIKNEVASGSYEHRCHGFDRIAGCSHHVIE